MSALRRPLRLLKLLPAFAIGGTERQVTALAGGLDRTRFDLRFGCFKRWGGFLPEIERLGLPVTEYPITSFHGLDTLLQQCRYARDLKRERIDIVHTYNFYANVFGIPAARAMGVPHVVASIRDLGAHLTPRQRRAQRWVCRLADGVVVNAEAVRRQLIADGYRAGRIAVIRNGLDPAQFASRPSGRLHRAVGLPAEARAVVMLARLDRHKGIEHFIDAAARLAAIQPDAHFVIFGARYRRGEGEAGVVPETSYLTELERRVAHHGLQQRVRFAGDQIDGPALLADAAVSVLPSLSEALPNTVLESMAAGVPVVASRVGGVPEAVVHGRDGLLVPPGDADALAEAIRAVLADRALAARLGAAARRRIEAEFTLERMTRETEAYYERLVARQARWQARRRQTNPLALRREDRRWTQ